MTVDAAIRARDRARARLERARVALARAGLERARSEAAPPDVRGWFERGRRLAAYQVWAANAALDAAEVEITRALWRRDLGTEPP